MCKATPVYIPRFIVFFTKSDGSKGMTIGSVVPSTTPKVICIKVDKNLGCYNGHDYVSVPKNKLTCIHPLEPWQAFNPSLAQFDPACAPAERTQEKAEE